jgi:hypothetical protein
VAGEGWRWQGPGRGGRPREQSDRLGGPGPRNVRSLRLPNPSGGGRHLSFQGGAYTTGAKVGGFGVRFEGVLGKKCQRTGRGGTDAARWRSLLLTWALFSRFLWEKQRAATGSGQRDPAMAGRSRGQVARPLPVAECALRIGSRLLEIGVMAGSQEPGARSQEPGGRSQLHWAEDRCDGREPAARGRTVRVGSNL